MEGSGLRSAEARAVELLIEQADAALNEDRYSAAIAAAGRAVEAAERLGHTTALLIRALETEADGLFMSGDHTGALAHYTRILSLAGDPAFHPDDAATEAIARTYTNWVEAARYAGGMPIRRLFAVLEDAEHWLTASGHRDWRARVMLERASLYEDLGEFDQAEAAARDALTAYRPDAPGHTLATHHYQLGDILRHAGRFEQAEPHFHAVLDNPDVGDFERSVGWTGLAWCAIARDDPATAVHHARLATETAEPLGDSALLGCLEVLAAAQRVAGDLGAAWDTATRYRQAADSVGGRFNLYHLYYAVRTEVDIALARADDDSAHRLLDELAQHAVALDRDTATTRRQDEVQERRRRLPSPGPR